MSRISVLLGAAALAGLAAPAFAGVPASSTDAVAIMKGVEKRDIGKSLTSYGVMKITPASGSAVTREMKNLRLKVGDTHRRIVLLAKPSDVRNMGLLIYDYDSGEKSDDQWLYLPSIKKTTRIVASDKASSFLGSDFYYSDITLLHASQYTFKLLKASTTVQGEDCWLIEGRPKDNKIKEETGYLKSEFWVSKSKLMVVQQRSFIASGKKTKLIKWEDIHNHEGVWIAHRTAARTLSSAGKPISTSIFQLSNVVVNASGLKDSDFTHARIEKGF
jgi:hypothetical protein